MDGCENNERLVTYIPAISITRITARHTLGRLPIAKEGAPDDICGTARRIGYTGCRASDLAIYRLKIKERLSNKAIMLPTLYVVDEGFFIDYNVWQKNHEILHD